MYAVLRVFLRLLKTYSSRMRFIDIDTPPLTFTEVFATDGQEHCTPPPLRHRTLYRKSLLLRHV